MRKLLIWSMALAAAAAAGMAAVTTGYAGRQTKRMTTASTAITHTRMGATVRVTAMTLVYDKAATNTLYVYTTQGSVTSLRATVGPFTNATTIVYAPAELWVWRQDLLVISNAVPAIANVIIDYSY